MSDFKHTDEERLSRRQAAERLVDIAYALTVGGPLKLNAAGRRIAFPVANELRLRRELMSEGDRVELELELTWAMPEGASASKCSRGD
jgi:amphi-Trp domain-containing protein